MTPWFAQTKICQSTRLFNANTGAMKPGRVSMGNELARECAIYTPIQNANTGATKPGRVSTKREVTWTNGSMDRWIDRDLTSGLEMFRQFAQCCHMRIFGKIYGKN